MCKFCRLHRGEGGQSAFVGPTKLTRCAAPPYAPVEYVLGYLPGLFRCL